MGFFVKMASPSTRRNRILFDKYLKVIIWFLVASYLCLLPSNAASERITELEVSEGVRVGHLIGYISKSTTRGTGGPPYLIVPVAGSSVHTDLTIDNKNGEIRTKVPLDREQRASYSFVAIPSSGGGDENIRVVVRVLDENDNPPTFPTAFMEIEFPENTPRDVKRTLNPARDLDLGLFSTQRYNIVSGNVNNAFRLSSHRERDGVLYLDLQINGFLDRETIPFYSLSIEALDGGSPPLRGEMTVNITILDVNDNQPIFNQGRYFASIPENTTVGTKVIQVFATDIDSGENGRIEYSINRRQSDKDQMFRIDPQTGVISVNKPLDFETKELHELVIVAKDHGEQPIETTTFLSIRVNDVNDNQPTISVIFLSDDATPKISESALPGEFVARISVNDPDSKTEYSNVNVTLAGGGGHFGLTTRDNIIYLVIVSLPLDREVQPNYTLNVIATDNGNPPLHASKTIYLRVTDINDNAPEFEKEVYHASVMEIADPGTSVLQVLAVDKDEGNNSAITYYLVDTPDTHSHWFLIDQNTGLITTRSHIDCETEPVPKLKVIAKDNGHPPLSSTATVLVTINDVNDNEPIFEQSYYNVTIAENEPVGRCVIKVSASDPDCGVNAMVNYTLGVIDSGPMKQMEFEVRPTSGEICISGDLDYEKRNSYEFPVIATDRGGLSTTAIVKIQLTDVNDNRPVFSSRICNVTLRESGVAAVTDATLLTTSATSAATSSIASSFATVYATDLDSGRFGSITYRIVAGNEAGLFRIDRVTGELFLNRPNMFTSPRMAAMYQLNISANDGGGLRTSQDAIVYINVIDGMQRSIASVCMFEKVMYNYVLKEDVLNGTIVGSVVASRSDTANPGIVRYTIYSGDQDGYFTIDQNGNIRISNHLDFERDSRILLNVQASIGHEPQTNGYTQVNINIEDVNDNQPQFESDIIRISIPENAEIGSPFYAAYAFDRDSGKNGIVTYRISQQESQSVTSTASGNNNSLAGRQFYNHKIGSTLSSSSSSSSTSSSYLGGGLFERFEMKQKQQNSAEVENKVEPKLFAIDSRSGHLTLSRHLDYETWQRHSLIVTASDSGLPSLSSNLTIFIEVQDVNDNAPVFELNEYKVDVLETLPSQSQILQVKAYDSDTGNNARLTYRLVGGEHQHHHQQQQQKIGSIRKQSPSSTLSSTATSTSNSNSNNSNNNAIDIFGIYSNSGWIYLRNSVDRETRDRYELTVIASDNGSPQLLVKTRVTINVLDANDNDPRFQKDFYDFSIEENRQRGTVVGRVIAKDIDLDANAAIRYSLIPSNTSFQINPMSGEITTREPLDRESRSLFELTVEARDQGTPSRSSRVQLKIHITDVNDNSPEIVDPQEDVVSVREEQPSGTEVVKIRAIDRDNGANASITYSILKNRDSDGYGLFTIDSNSGIIRTKVALDHEERIVYQLLVAATDAGKPPRQTTLMLRVEVLDLNDNRPTFTSSSLMFKIPENSPIGTMVGSIYTNDHMDAQNLISSSQADTLAISYTITSLSNDKHEGVFELDRQTGILVVAHILDREEQSEYKLEIRALDTTTTSNPQSSKITVKIEVMDINDNPPVWPDDPIIIEVEENLEIGQIIHNFTATDADDGFNAEMQYTMIDQTPHDDSNVFSLDPLTGSLTLIKTLDYENQKEYILVIQAIDQSKNITQRLHTTVTALILIQDVNDNRPVFVSPSQDTTIMLSSGIQVGQLVTHVLAIDKDSDGDNGRIKYSILSGNDGGHFKIHEGTGFVELIKPLPIMRSGEGDINVNSNKFEMVVSATDGGVPLPLEATLNLKFIIHGTSTSPPRFLQSYYYANISEDARPHSFVLRVNARSYNDGGDNENLTYQIPNGIADNHFIVDGKSGVVSTRGHFNREHVDKYTIPIYVFETTTTPSSGSAALPSTSSTTTTSTLSSSSSSSSLSSTSSSPLSSTSSADGHFDIATIIVYINDVNDHAPEFRPGSCYPLSVPENSELSVIHTVVATDWDDGPNGDIIYSIIGGNLGNKFSIDMHTGELTARSLDREQKTRYLLQIQAQDRGTPIMFEDQCNISVIVEDQNDNDPIFEQPKYITNIPEDIEIGSSVLKVRATDKDLGRNARIIYSLANETTWLFTIDNKSGLITTVGTLDREHQHIYNFMVVATDGGRYDSRSQRVPVQITVDDINDNKPVFEQYPFKAQVQTLVQPGQNLIQVNALDQDEGINSEVVYSIVHDTNSGKFRINPNTGVLSSTQSLSSENGKLLHIEVMARDKGNPPLSSIGLIELRIGELQAGTPTLRFQNSTYSVHLKENTPTGVSVVNVAAVRSDGRRQKIIYSIGSGNDDGTFSIDAITGEIKVRNPQYLDYEKYAMNGYRDRSKSILGQNYQEDNNNEPSGLKLIIVARTDGSPLLYGYTEVHVILEDENDNGPHFTQQQYSATVWEGNNKGTFVMQVKAFDGDAGANSRILYHIVDGNHDNAFIIEPAFSGIVKTNIVLDREIRDLYSLKVIATDEGIPQMTGTTTIRIHIVDVNDNQPTFPPHKIINVSEGTDLGTVITTISANDVDTYPALTYRFIDDNDTAMKRNDLAMFAIDRYSGKVVLKKPLDYEQQQEYILEVAASDTAHEAKTRLTFRVTDENDNPPIFQQSTYSALLPDQDQLPSIAYELLTVNATDSDSDINAKIRYSIEPSVTGFTINEITGTIYVNSSLVDKHMGDLFLMVIATDAGEYPLKGTAVVKVGANSNSNSKVQFLQTQYRTSVSEDADLGTTILKLGHEILDFDEEVKHRLDFALVSGNEDGVFEVCQSESVILVKPLNREKTDLYKLRLIIKGVPGNASVINIFVTVDDVNDNSPMFIKNGKYAAEVSELAPHRHSIARLLAVDADMENTPNSEVVYDITSGNDDGMFTIDLVTGILFVNNKLDYDEGATIYNLIIRACDSGNVSLCTLHPFRIALADENDNNPKFPVHEYIEYIRENEPIDTTIFTARATDLDKGRYGQLNYTIEPSSSMYGSDDAWKLFTIDELSGIVTTNAVFDYEERSRYDFMVKATDIGGKSAVVKVRLLIDSNDEYSPQFTERTYHFVMSPSSIGYLPLGYVVGQVTATDRDKGPDGHVVYQLTSQNPYFKVNRTSGAVSIKKRLDDDAFIDGRDITLVVSAGTGRPQSLTNMSLVEISLDPLADPGTNLASSSSTAGDWAIGLTVFILLVVSGVAGVYMFLHFRNKTHKHVSKPNLNTEPVGNSNSYVDPSAFDTMPIGRANANNNTASGQFAPPKYDEIPPYGPHGGNSSSGAATTSELSGSEQSGSSGRGSAEDDGEDEEIRMINEGPLRRDHHHGAGSDGGRISEISVQNTQEYLARLGIIDNPTTTGGASNSSRHCTDSIAGSNKSSHIHHGLHMFPEEDGQENDITNLIYAKLTDVNGEGSASGSDRASSVDEAATTIGSIGTAVDHVMAFGDVPVPVVGNVTGSLSSIVHSEEELTGSYNWDYLLDWGPQYQPLAHVFSEIARLKDDTMSIHSGNSATSSAKSKQSLAKHIPPPLLTNIAPRAINVPLMSSRGISNNQYMLPRSPINHDTPGGFSTSTAMSPSFSPSLSPLATGSPSMTPHVHHMAAMQRQPQPSHRKSLDTDMRVRL